MAYQISISNVTKDKFITDLKTIFKKWENQKEPALTSDVVASDLGETIITFVNSCTIESV